MRLPLLSGEALYGYQAVGNALRFPSRPKLHKLFVQGSVRRVQAHQGLLEDARRLEIPTVPTSKHQLDLMSRGRPHQGLVLDCAPIIPRELEVTELVPEPQRLLLALDEVQDPQNLGAILRSAWYFGVEHVMISGRNSAPLSPVVSKASAGALEVLVGTRRLSVVPRSTNMPAVLKQVAAEGFRVVGTDLGPDACDAADLDPGLPTVMVFGNEGHGLRTNVKRVCTNLAKIPQQESCIDSGLDSLNVSVSVGILLWHLRHR